MCTRFPLRVQVEEANNARLEALTGEEQTYHAENIPGLDMNDNLISMPQACKLLDNTLAPRALRLRPGAQVMLTVVPAHSVSSSSSSFDCIFRTSGTLDSSMAP